jgi:hypothetical protein
LKEAVNVYLEVLVVEVLLIDPKRHEHDHEKLEEDEDPREPGDALPDRSIVLFAARNPSPLPEKSSLTLTALEVNGSYGQLVSSERDDWILSSHKNPGSQDNILRIENNHSNRSNGS